MFAYLTSLDFAMLGVLILFIPLVHELGHASMARLAGMRIAGLDLWAVAIRATTSGWRVRRARRGLRLAAVHLIVTGPPGRARRRDVAMLAAGPAAGLALGMLYAGLAWTPLADAPGTGNTLRAAALISVIEMVNFLPISERTDGWKLVTWFTKPDVMRLRVATSNLLLYAGQGLRPSHWPTPWVAVAAEMPAGRDLARYATARYLAYLAARDAGQLDAAWRHLSAALGPIAALSPGQGGGLLAEAALHHAWTFRDPETARLLLQRVPRIDGMSVFRRRALAAIALAEGNRAVAISACDTILAAPDSIDQAGISTALKDWTRAIRAEAAALPTTTDA